MTTIYQYTHLPNNTELGKGNTHETYLLISREIDLSFMFPPGANINVHNIEKNTDYSLKAATGSEFRVNQMGQFYRDFDIHEGDEIVLTKLVSESCSHITIRAIKHHRVLIKVGTYGASIADIERLSGFGSKDGGYRIPITNDGAACNLSIHFVGEKRKRSDSPSTTDYYSVYLDGQPLDKGSYLLDLDSPQLIIYQKSRLEVVSLNGEKVPLTSEVVLNSLILTKGNPEQIIYFGSPGTGKSRAVADYLDELIKNGKLKKENIFRTTFHPDYDFASFVGTYKPVMRSYSNIVSAGYTFSELADLLKKEYASSENKVATLHGFILKHIGYFNGQIARFNYKEFCQSAGLSETYYAEITKMVNLYDWMQDNNFITTNDSISYEFEPQVFTEAYVRAWEDTNERVYLVIEEINRGNCAQIFGDLFQLLDRKDGVSEYPVKADAALRKYLEKALLEGSTGIERGLLSLPANFNIIATMNTSDQSLFPMDSAFKRRWNWKYMPTLAPTGKENILKYTLEQNRTQDNVTINAGDYEYKWTEFLDRINRKILKATGSEDKQLGFWFVKGQNGTNEISVSTFVSKVVFYLWNDVFKDVGPKEYNPFVCMTADQRRVIMPFNTFFELNPEGKVVENIGVLHTFLRNVGLLPFIKPAIADAQNKADSNGETFENE